MRWCARPGRLFAILTSTFLRAFAGRVLLPFPPAADVDTDIDQIGDYAGHALGNDSEYEPAEAPDGADEEAKFALLSKKPRAEEIADHPYPIRAVEAAETFHGKPICSQSGFVNTDPIRDPSY